MKNAEAILSVKFNSTHNPEQLAVICAEDLEIFRNVPGLVQKYYIAEGSTGALSGLYFFETKAAREAYWSSELAKSVPARYGIIPETLRVEQYEVSIVLNDAAVLSE